MSSTRAEDLHAILQAAFKAHLAACAQEWPAGDVIVRCTCTYRSAAEQDALWALGRTVKSYVGPWTDSRPLGSIVTRAHGGQSAHNFTLNGKPAALAYDLAIIFHGKAIWEAESPLWVRVGELGTQLGLNWYGAKDAPFHETPHFQHALARDIMAGRAAA